MTKFRRNPYFPVNTLQIMGSAVAAQIDGGFAVIRSVLGDRVLERAQDPAVKARLVANTEASVNRGCFGSPTFFVGDDMYFGKDRLRDVEEAIAAG